MSEVGLIMPMHFLTGATMSIQRNPVQQHRGRIPDIQSMDGGHGGETRQNCCNPRHGADRPLLVRPGEIPAG